MEAKDIRKQPVTNEIFSREDLDNAFKAGERRGYDQGVEDRLREIDALTARVKTAKQIGRKEVVEFVEKHSCNWDSLSFNDRLADKEPTKMRTAEFEEKLWNVQLKDWQSHRDI